MGVPKLELGDEKGGGRGRPPHHFSQAGGRRH